MKKIFSSGQIFTKHSKSWNLKHEGIFVPNETSSFAKFKLLLWKNWKIQFRHKIQTITEIVLPLLFIIILVVIRNITPSTKISQETIYTPFEVHDVPPAIIRTRCDKIFYSPSNPVVDEIMDKVRKDFFSGQFILDYLNYTFVGFNSEEEMIKAQKKSGGDLRENLVTNEFQISEPVLAGVVFLNKFNSDGSFSKDIKIKLRFPANQRSEFDVITERFGIQPNWFTEISFPLFQLLGPRSGEKNRAGLPGYDSEGFLYLQYAIDSTLTNYFINKDRNETVIEYEEDYNNENAESTTPTTTINPTTIDPTINPTLIDPIDDDESFLINETSFNSLLTQLKRRKDQNFYKKYNIHLQRFPYIPYYEDKFLFAMQVKSKIDLF